jgi:hypothetical protein
VFPAPHAAAFSAKLNFKIVFGLQISSIKFMQSNMGAMYHCNVIATRNCPSAYFSFTESSILTNAVIVETGHNIKALSLIDG